MKRFLVSLISVAAIAGAAAPAFAQAGRFGDWQPLSVRQATIERRIDQGVRSGQLTRREAVGLRNEFRGLLRLEARYESDGRFSRFERNDLQHRFDILSDRVRYDKHDNQTRYGPARYR
jgi:hypothetical protein